MAILKISKEIAKTIFICGGQARNIPDWARHITHFTQEEFPRIPTSAIHCIILADFIAHTKQTYIEKFFFGQIHVVHGGRTRLTDKLFEIVNNL